MKVREGMLACRWRTLYPPPAGGGLIEGLKVANATGDQKYIPRPRAGASLKELPCRDTRAASLVISPARGRGPH